MVGKQSSNTTMQTILIWSIGWPKSYLVWRLKTISFYFWYNILLELDKFFSGIFFGLFLLRLNRYQALPGYVHGQIWPHSTCLWWGFFGTPCMYTQQTRLAIPWPGPSDTKSLWVLHHHHHHQHCDLEEGRWPPEVGHRLPPRKFKAGRCPIWAQGAPSEQTVPPPLSWPCPSAICTFVRGQQRQAVADPMLLHLLLQTHWSTITLLVVAADALASAAPSPSWCHVLLDNEQ